MPSSIRKALNELPITLDDTYERMLQGIPKEKFEHASRLFQCMVAAVRPLRVEELGELFAIEFGANNAPNLVAGWRPENPEEAVLSTCSTFITIIDGGGDGSGDGDDDRDSDDDDDNSNGDDDYSDDDDDNNDDEGPKIVQFSHFSVKEFLTSDRLQLSSIGNIRQYYIPLEPAHAILARACVAVLLQVDEEQDEGRFRTLPLGSYAIEHWVRHAGFEGVASRIEDSLGYLFDPKMPFFKPRILLRCVEGMDDIYPYKPGRFSDEPDKVTPLYLAAFCGFSGLVKHLIITHAPDVNAECGGGLSPLHVASIGQVDCARILLDNGAHVNTQESANWAPLHFASYNGHLEVAQLLLERGADLNAQTKIQDTPLCLASEGGHLETVRVLLDHGADLNIKETHNQTPYQIATLNGYHDVAQLLLEHGAERV